MRNEEMLALIEQYVEVHIQEKGEKDIVRKLLIGSDDASFINKWQEYNGDYHAAISEAVKSCTTNKQKAISRYKNFISYIKRKTDEEINVEWPSVDISNRAERLIYIMRVLQTEQADAVQFLSDKLWMSTRSIEGELSELRHTNADAPSSFLDQSLVINGISRSNGSIQFLSTVHPMLLMENLTGVLYMIHALLEKALNPVFKDWVMVTAGHIWNQLTDYAKAKVEKKTHEFYSEDSPVLYLFEELKTMPNEGKFITEQEFKNSILNITSYCAKADLMCRYYCHGKDGTTTTHVGYPCDIVEIKDFIHIRHLDGSKEKLYISDIMKCEEIPN